MAEGDIRREKPDGVRKLAVLGLLADHARTVGDDERRRLRAEAYEIVHPIVFHQFTRKIELKRGHTWCATSLRRLEPPCLDRFHEDMDAVLDDIFRNAKVPIHNFEGWVSRRMLVATIEGYRRRRGRRGALQRPRVPAWLATELGQDPWLVTLAVAVLEFVGNDIPAVPGTWPLDAWAQRRALMLGDDHHGDVSHDIERVLAAMRTRPKWNESYVERPLSGKQPPVVALTTESTEDDLASPTYDADTLLIELAALAVDAIERRLATGEDPRSVVVDVVRTVFDSAGATATAVDERVAACLADSAEIERLTAAVLDIVASDGHDE